MSKAKISVIIPIYNAEEYLVQTLESLINTDYENLEIILVDDGSPDRCGRICDEYAARDGRITVIHKHNGGVSSARNAGLDAATGDMIAFLDSDDLIEPEIYSYLSECAELYSADLVQCATYFDEGDSTRVLNSAPEDIPTSLHSKKFHSHFMRYFNYGCCCKLYRRELIRNIRFDESATIGEDLLFNLHALTRANRIALCREPMYHYVQRADSAMHTTAREDRLTAFRNTVTAAEGISRGTALENILTDILLLDSADLASKLVTGGRDITDELFRLIRNDTKSKVAHLLFKSKINVKNRLKLLLVAYMPKIYKTLLIKTKSANN